MSREELAERLQNFELSEADFRRQSVPVAMSTAVNKVYAAVELDGEEVSELVNPSALMSYEDFVTWQKGNKAAYERSAEYKKAKAKLELDIRGMLSAGKSAVEIESELGLVGGEEEEEAALKRAYAEYESIVKAEEEEVRAARWYLTEGKWDYKEAWRKEREILQKYADDESLEWSHEDYIYIRKYTQALLGYVKEDVVNRAPRVMSELLSLYKTGVHSEYEHKKGSEEIRELVSAGSAAWCNGKMLEGKEKSKEKAANCAKVSEGAVIIGIIGSPLSGVRGEKEGSEEYLQKYMEEYYDSLAGANVIVNSAVGLLNLGERGVRRLKNVLLNLANKEEIESTKGVFSRGMVGMLAEVGIVGAKGFSDERTIVNGGYYLDGVSKVGSYVDKDLANNREHLINGGAWLEHVLVSNAWEDVGRMIADYEGVDGKGCKECAEVISYAVSKSVSKWGEATTVAGNIPFLVGAAQGSKNIKISDKQKIADGIFGLSFTDLNAANNLALDKKLAYIKGIDAAVYAKGYDIRGKQKSYERSGRIMSGAGVADIVLSVGFAASLARGAVSGARSWVSMFRQASKLKGLGRVPSVRAGISRITVQNLRRAHAQTLLKAPAGRVIPGTERAVNLHNKEISGMKVSVKGAAHNYQNTGSLPKKITPPVRTRATGLKVLEEKPELVAKGNGYNVRKLNDKTLILDLGQRMPGVQPRATGTLTAQAGEGSGGSANSAGPGISTGNVSKYDLLMEVKSTMPKYEPTTVRQPTFRDKFNHVMWQTKMRAAMLSTPVGTTGAVAEGALVTPTQIVSQSKAPASLFDIVESADAARPQRFIGKGTTLVKPQVSALPKSSSAPKTNLLNVGTNRGRGNYHISTPAVTVMAAGYNPLTGRAPYKPTETIHAYANITTPTIEFKSNLQNLPAEISNINNTIGGKVKQILKTPEVQAAASAAALLTLAGASSLLGGGADVSGISDVVGIGGVTTALSFPFIKPIKQSSASENGEENNNPSKNPFTKFLDKLKGIALKLKENILASDVTGIPNQKKADILISTDKLPDYTPSLTEDGKQEMVSHTKLYVQDLLANENAAPELLAHVQIVGTDKDIHKALKGHNLLLVIDADFPDGQFVLMNGKGKLNVNVDLALNELKPVDLIKHATAEGQINSEIAKTSLLKRAFVALQALIMVGGLETLGFQLVGPIQKVLGISDFWTTFLNIAMFSPFLITGMIAGELSKIFSNKFVSTIGLTLTAASLFGLYASGMDGNFEVWNSPMAQYWSIFGSFVLLSIGTGIVSSMAGPLVSALIPNKQVRTQENAKAIIAKAWGTFFGASLAPVVAAAITGDATSSLYFLLPAVMLANIFFNLIPTGKNIPNIKTEAQKGAENDAVQIKPATFKNVKEFLQNKENKNEVNKTIFYYLSNIAEAGLALYIGMMAARQDYSEVVKHAYSFIAFAASFLGGRYLARTLMNKFPDYSYRWASTLIMGAGIGISIAGLASGIFELEVLGVFLTELGISTMFTNSYVDAATKPENQAIQNTLILSSIFACGAGAALMGGLSTLSTNYLGVPQDIATPIFIFLVPALILLASAKKFFYADGYYEKVKEVLSKEQSWVKKVMESPAYKAVEKAVQKSFSFIKASPYNKEKNNENK
ncbi:MFS transporter [Parelusimicrobium proximum]|uniref:MFS transporter n=1 Tax=Parelusimicrobium proximum TaxID=3228953 RepID=UPI003D185E3C